MAKLTVPLQCYQCDGMKVLYRSGVGDHKKTDFTLGDLVQLTTSGALNSIQCPVCTGRGVVDVLARE